MKWGRHMGLGGSAFGLADVGVQVLGKITKDGVFLEALETNPAKVRGSPPCVHMHTTYLTCFAVPAGSHGGGSGRRDAGCASGPKPTHGSNPSHSERVPYPVGIQPSWHSTWLTRGCLSTRLSLSGTLIVARDIAHAKLQERIENGEGLPEYMKDHIVYYGTASMLYPPSHMH